MIMAEYIFEGEVIKLTPKDFYKWQDMYKSLDLVHELQQLDMELEAKQREGGSVKKWFSECVARLNGRNKRAERFNRGQNQQSTSYGSGAGKVSYADRARQDAITALDRLDGKTGNSFVQANGGFIRN